jgi:hypothetical protein
MSFCEHVLWQEAILFEGAMCSGRTFPVSRFGYLAEPSFRSGTKTRSAR